VKNKFFIRNFEPAAQSLQVVRKGMVIKMKVEFKRDLHHNFMVLSGFNNAAESYCIKMLTYQQIEGILPMEIQTINNQAFYNYEITAKQSMNTLLDRTVLSFDRVRKIFQNLMDTIEKSSDYLLLPDGFLLAPEYVYLDINTDLPYLCYVPGYQNNIKEQMSGFIEYIMNKVDYNDKEAVLLVYRLYAVSKEEGYTFHHLNTVIQNCSRSNPQGKAVNVQESRENLDKTPDSFQRSPLDRAKINELQMIPEDSADEVKSMKNNKPWKNIGRSDREQNNREQNDKEKKAKEKLSIPISKNIPVMMEKIVGEQEVFCYPLKTYLLSMISFLGGILLVVLCCRTKIIYNTFGNRIDYSKLFALLLILICLEGYLMKQVWNKKNRITKMVAKSEYIDPRQNLGREPDVRKNMKFSREGELIDEECGLSGENSDGKWIDRSERLEETNNPIDSWERNEDNVDTNSSMREKLCESESMDTLGYRDIEELKDSENEKSEDKKDRRDEKNEDREECEDEEYNPTCLLNEVQGEPFYILDPVDKKQYEIIQIKEFPFFIGKIKKNVDYCLEKDVVSRYHAKILKEQDQFYLADLNSTNGTFLNGELLQPYSKKEMKLGDEIAFANIKFIFK